jgi:putative phosphoesterase
MAAPKLARKTIAFEKDTVRIGVVADTHSKPHPDALKLLRERAPDHVLHAGDIGDEKVLAALAKVAPVTAVRGNIDAASSLPDAIALRIEAGGMVLPILLTHIAVFGPKLRKEVRALAEKEGAELVVCGHSHVPFLGADRGIATFNPGSIGPKRFQLPIVFGVMDVSASGVKLVHVSCETGSEWRP